MSINTSEVSFLARNKVMPLFGICFTLNNYSDLEESIVRGSVGEVGIKYIIYGKEVGESGTPHLQGYMQVNHDKYDRLKRRFGDRIHLEKQRGDSAEARDYCKKDGEWYEFGRYEHIASPKKRQGERKDLDLVKEAIKEGKSYDELVDTHFGTVAKYGRFIKECIQARENGRLVHSLKESFGSAQLRPWQQSLWDKLQGDPHPREILWYWEESGNVGKSWMTRYLLALTDCTVLTDGKKVDMAYIFAKKPTKIVIFDLARVTEEHLDGIYVLAENLKNGYLVSAKYDSTGVVFETPHVVFFANFGPNLTKWSADRYFINKID